MVNETNVLIVAREDMETALLTFDASQFFKMECYSHLAPVTTFF
jgi:hypothetical protein